MSAVAVVAVGARTPVGLTALQTGFLLRAGFPAMGESPLADAAGEAVTMGLVPTIDPRLTGPGRLAALARAPLEEATSAIGMLRVEAHLVLDEDLPDPKLAMSVLDAMIARVLPGATVSVEPRGEAGPGTLIAGATRALESRRVDAVVIGGVHSDHDPWAIAALEASGRLFTRENLDSRIPGEAAAFFVLMRAGDAPRHGLTPLARVLGVGTGDERAHADNDLQAAEAHGMTAAVRETTRHLTEGGGTAGWLLTDLTYEVRRLREWESVFVRAQNILGRPYLLESPAQRIGYLGAAALPLFTVMAATAFRHGYAPSPTALALAGNDTGARAALLLGKA